jgi:hypothetical protein
MKYEPRSRKNTICDVVSAGECLVRPNCMPSLISMFFVHALHLQFYPCSVLLCLFSAIHKGIHACNCNRVHLLSVQILDKHE